MTKETKNKEQNYEMEPLHNEYCPYRSEEALQERLKDRKYIAKEVSKSGLTALVSVSLFAGTVLGLSKCNSDKNYTSYQEYHYFNQPLKAEDK